MNRGTMRWLGSLGRRFLNVAPAATLTIIICAVSSQVLAAIAAFLPFKALALAVREVDTFHLLNSAHNERRDLILGLCLLAFGCYVGHLLCRRKLELAVVRGSKLLLDRNAKLGLFEKQESVAEESYRRFATGTANLLIALVCVALLSFWNRPLFAEVLIYTSLVVLVAWLLAQASKLNNDFITNPTDLTLDAIAGLGFVTSFVFIVFEFIGTEHALMVSVGSLILVRQYFRSLTTIFRSAKELARKRLQISAIFFHHQILIDQEHSDDFWRQFQFEHREELLQRVLTAVLGESHQIESVEWLHSGITDVVSLLVAVNVESQKRHLCLRFFNQSRTAMARHETALLSAGLRLPPNGFIGVLCTSKAFHCLVFDLTGYRSVVGDELTAAMTQLRRQLLYLMVPEDFVSLCSRSKSFLWQRLSTEMADRLAGMLNSEQVEPVLTQFKSNLPHIIALLRQLPLGLVQPGMSKHNVFSDTRGRALLMGWESWTLEGLGYGWPADNQARLEQLEAAMMDAQVHRRDLFFSVVPVARLCALFAAFEHRYQRQDYRAALDYLTRGMTEYRRLSTGVLAKQGAN